MLYFSTKLDRGGFPLTLRGVYEIEMVFVPVGTQSRNAKLKYFRLCRKKMKVNLGEQEVCLFGRSAIGLNIM